jgi:hypothetical protein
MEEYDYNDSLLDNDDLNAPQNINQSNRITHEVKVQVPVNNIEPEKTEERK